MHLLASTSGVLDGGAEAIDLKQSPGDVVVLTAADSELAALASAHDALRPGFSLRLANLLQLQHNLSVDLYCEQTLAHAKLIVLRLLGGAGYWPYGLDAVEALARDKAIALTVLPGGTEADAALSARSTLSAAEVERLRQCFAFGGPENMRHFLVLCGRRLSHMLEGDADAATPFPKAGIYGEQHGAAGRAAIVFYRSVVEGGQTAPVDALLSALAARGLATKAIYVASLKDDESTTFLRASLSDDDVILNCTSFALGGADDPFARLDCPVLQCVLAGSSEAAWTEGKQGLGTRDLAMNVVLPELDGRILSRAISFKSDAHWHEATQCRIVTYAPVQDRVDFVADLAANWVKLRCKPNSEKRVGLILANYPNKDGRIANGVGYDTPASTIAVLRTLKTEGYHVEDVPPDGNALIERLQAGATNSGLRGASTAQMTLEDYRARFAVLPPSLKSQLAARWSEPEADPFFRDGAFHLPVVLFGNIAAAIQPARGYNINPKATYHDPALVPPHGYLAFYWWLRDHFGAQALIHNGKHGNLEWLPGKATALSNECWPEAAIGPLPQLYPFIVNDPGEGTQAKRRTSAVIIDHLTPPLTRAETYGPLKDLEALVDEYYLAAGLDRRRLTALKKDILALTRHHQLDKDAGFTGDDDTDLQKLDAFLCDLKEAQIRDGLHILGASPAGQQETDLLVALTRVPRGLGEGLDASLIRALADDFELGFDPLTCEMATPWTGPRPEALNITDTPWRTFGDTVERLELLAQRLVSRSEISGGTRSGTVLDFIESNLRPLLRGCGQGELGAVVGGLAGRHVAPGASGAPTRGRLDVLPTGRNFYSLDNRTVPTPTAWTLGEKSAEDLLRRHFQDFGQYPKSIGLSAWGTSNMRTGGDDIAQALALIGAKPVWEPSSWRITGFELIPPAKLGRPRVDVTFRISGFFRDAFPAQVELLDKAMRAAGALEEDAADNPIAARMASEAKALAASGLAPEEARHLAGHRVFGSKPGAYGAGLQALIDERIWTDRKDFAAAYVAWGSFAYGARDHGAAQAEIFCTRLKSIEAVVHNQDNREHDLLDSDDYYQFEGGLSAAVEEASGKQPRVYHNDHSRPERPVIRTLEEEISRVMRSRVVNPKWIAGVKRHGYKGAFEIAATVDYMFAFAATTGAVKSHHFDIAHEAYLADEDTRAFLAANNPAALREIAERFEEAIARGLWTPRSNSAYTLLQELTR